MFDSCRGHLNPPSVVKIDYANYLYAFLEEIIKGSGFRAIPQDYR